jgi:DNA-directed RNA polymerase specialized sigma24 family protein
MASDGSVTRWIGGLQAGTPEAAQQLWQRYFAQLVGLARFKLRGAACRMADEEDVALSVFDSFCRGAEQGRFPQMDDRDNLWRLLMVLTARKASNLRRDENRKKRGGGAAGKDGPHQNDLELEQVMSREPSPEFAAQVADECEKLLAALGDETLRAVAQAKMEGYTTEEIAKTLHYSLRTVERKLGLIRAIWEQEGEP